ncbi:hypothetical protein HG530_015044 [Fusarium avenaceum]|nr:hypothetical protein HG530_015044 [Fusarium avenaceum]
MSEHTKSGENKSADDSFEFIPNAVNQVEVLDESEGDKSSDWTDGGIQLPKKETPAATNVEVMDTAALRRQIHDAMKDEDSLYMPEVQSWINGLGVVFPNALDPEDEDETEAMFASGVLENSKAKGKKEDDAPAGSSCKGNRSPKKISAIKERARKRLAGVLKFLEPELQSNKKK